MWISGSQAWRAGGGPARGVPGLVALGALALILAGCAPTSVEVPARPVADPAATPLRATLVKGMSEIQSVYIEDIAAETLARAALDGLGQLDREILIGWEADALAVARAGDGQMRRVRLPAGGSGAAWGAVVAEATLAARELSPRLSSMETEALQQALFGAMTGLLDRYSRYAGREAAAANRAEREGYGGIGVTIRAHAEGALIEAVDAGAPAAGAGLSVDDVIVAIDGRALAGLPLATIADRLRGPVDRAVLLTIRRMGLDSVQDVEVGRTRIVPNTVALEIDGALAVIRITGFNRLTAKRLSEALARASLIARPRLEGIVLDLRGNLGGVLDQAIEAADLLLDRGILLETYGRHPASRQHFEAEPGDVTGGLPIVVLIDGASASSAEILASALQDNDRAVVVGASSFGKGTVQTVIPLDDGAGAGGELILTWAEFVAPSGYGLHLVGVLPTICTSGAPGAGEALRGALANEAVAVRRAFAVRRSTDHRDTVDRRRALSLCPWRPTQGAGDIDMEVAERLLAWPEAYAALRRAALPPSATAAP